MTQVESICGVVSPLSSSASANQTGSVARCKQQLLDHNMARARLTQDKISTPLFREKAVPEVL